MRLRRKALLEIDPAEALRNLGLVEDETLGIETRDLLFMLDRGYVYAGSGGPVYAMRRFLERTGRPAKRYRIDRGYVYLR